MKALKTEILNKINEYDKKASTGSIDYSELQEVEELCGIYLKLYHVSEISDESKSIIEDVNDLSESKNNQIKVY